jgi:hypothetical protein
MWELDERGRPIWLASYGDARWGRWAWVISPEELAPKASPRPHTRGIELALAAGPASMPSMGTKLARQLRPAEPDRPRVGRPTIERSHPFEARWAAWVSDMRDVSTWEISRRLAPWAFEGDLAEPARPVATANQTTPQGLARPRANERSTRRLGERRLRAGRSMLNRMGILPWLIWPHGEVPTGWWADPLFAEGLRVWHHVYVDQLRPAIAALKKSVEQGGTQVRPDGPAGASLDLPTHR